MVTTNTGEEVQGFPKHETGPHFVYELWTAIRPAKEVKNVQSIQQSARVKAMLDLLLTCDTITEAWKKTNERLNQKEEPSG